MDNLRLLKKNPNRLIQKVLPTYQYYFSDVLIVPDYRTTHNQRMTLEFVSKVILSVAQVIHYNKHNRYILNLTLR